jgi:hypothetical protein
LGRHGRLSNAKLTELNSRKLILIIKTDKVISEILVFEIPEVGLMSLMNESINFSYLLSAPRGRFAILIAFLLICLDLQPAQAGETFFHQGEMDQRCILMKQYEAA